LEVNNHERSCRLYDRIVVKRLEEKESIQGGIIIPDSARKNPGGEVVAVGRVSAWKTESW